jgi:hypothetical protein
MAYKGLRGKVWGGTTGEWAKVWGTPTDAAVKTGGGGGGIYRGWEGWRKKYEDNVPRKKLVKYVKKFISKQKKKTLDEQLQPNFSPLVWRLPSRAILPLFSASYEALWGDRKEATIAYECAQKLEVILDQDEEEALMFILMEML